MAKLIIGLTGGIGSGKSAACHCFSQYGIDIIDADIIARDVVSPNTEALKLIVNHFGKQILTADNALDRSQLRGIIFNNKAEQTWLNNLLHPLIRQEMISQSQHAKSQYAILAIPLLVENQLQSLVDRILVIDCPVATQIKRASERDNNSVELINNIIKSQASRAERSAIADDIIDNSRDLFYLSKQISQLHRHYLSLI